MKQNVLASYNGKIFEATGALPKDALVFAPSQKSSAQIIAEQRASQKLNSKLIKARFEAATKR